MRNILLAIVVAALPASAAAAEPSSVLKPDKPAASDRLLPMKGTSAGNSCAAFGPGFVKLAGSDTCVKIGGAVSVDIGGSRAGAWLYPSSDGHRSAMLLRMSGLRALMMRS